MIKTTSIVNIQSEYRSAILHSKHFEPREYENVSGISSLIVHTIYLQGDYMLVSVVYTTINSIHKSIIGAIVIRCTSNED